ncbi:hypothetical protein EB796_013450 [Bugula neritina]|uniref:Uncharacterized protein n=1 Tax=Bugula neritina TaxID=10212 RepID=A0A7J7JS25_BUGNE|nr:hypothetical protein EB796_013450 [Bugula neritina]
MAGSSGNGGVTDSISTSSSSSVKKPFVTESCDGLVGGGVSVTVGGLVSDETGGWLLVLYPFVWIQLILHML